jgi:polyisoprenoid-binding protein YceI
MKTTWRLDGAQSDVLIKMKHNVIAYLAGGTNTFDGYIDIENNTIEDASIAFLLDVNNKNKPLHQVKKHQNMNDLFDVNQYPMIRFQSTSFEKVTNNINFLKGNLTIQNVTKAVELDAEFIGFNANNGHKKAAFEITGKINRKDFNISENPFSSYGVAYNNQELKLIANFEFTV